jgi:threonine aldolase
MLHGLHGLLVGDPDRLITLGDLEGIHEPVAALLLELPQREIGGLLPVWDDLVAQTGWARERGVALHLDGARLWQTGPFYERDHAQIAGLFDSVYVSFYKDLDALAGAALAGDAGFVAEARVWQRRHGGNLVTMQPFVVSAELALDQRLERIPEYVEHARALAAALGAVDGITSRPRAPRRRRPRGRGKAEGVPVRRSRPHHVALRAAPRGDGRRRHASARPRGGGGALRGRADAGESAVTAMPCRAGGPP